MKVSVEQGENCQAVLNIEVEPEEIEASEEASYRRLVKKVNMPGFRKGKAPRAVLERYISKDVFREDVLEHLVPETCARAIEERLARDGERSTKNEVQDKAALLSRMDKLKEEIGSIGIPTAELVEEGRRR